MKCRKKGASLIQCCAGEVAALTDKQAAGEAVNPGWRESCICSLAKLQEGRLFVFLPEQEFSESPFSLIDNAY